MMLEKITYTIVRMYRKGENMNFSTKIKEIRNKKEISLQKLSDLSGVSKSMISKIEREEKNPTLQVAAQIAEALGTTLSSLLDEPKNQEIVIIKKDERITYQDELTGFQRILISPQLETEGIEFIKNIIPKGAKSPDFPAHRNGVKEYITISKGKLLALIGDQKFYLEAGDSIFFQANNKHQFENIGDTECHYYLIIDSHGA